MPRCRTCGERMEYWVPGLADDKHEHPECAGRRMAEAALRKIGADVLLRQPHERAEG